MTGPEIVQFSDAVKRAFNVGELTALLLGIDRRFEDYVVALSPYPEQVVELVARANSENWIARLVAEVVRERPLNAAIVAFLGNNPEWDPGRSMAVGHPCDTLRLFGGKSFIGRRQFRRYLKEMNTPTGRKVLIVTSDHRRVGKTYSTELVSYLARNQLPSEMIYFDLDRDDYEPGKLAIGIAKGIGIAPAGAPTQGEQQAPRWNQELVDWIVQTTPQVPALQPVWWIVLDGFRQRLLSEAMQDFIAQLAQRIQSTQRFRLLLLDYTYRLPLKVEAFAFKEQVQPIARAEVEAFLSTIHERTHGSKPTAEELAEYTSAVYEQVTQIAIANPNEAEDQLILNMAVSAAVDVIQSGA